MSKTSRDGFSGSADTVESRGPTEPAGDARIHWQWSRFNELSIDDLYAAVRLREAVFIIEQNCPYPDADGRDPAAWHLLGWSIAGERRLLAYTRVFEPGVRYMEASIGRVVTAPEVRGTGLGRVLMAEALRRVESLVPGRVVKIAAQRRLEKFYLGFGFESVSEPYEEDGIMHVDMVRQA
ncbi:MAG TPA: GNAT family N-acetyltransferase [Gemmatimonadaceae bacterium]|jgi:ElaA protein|nr:GNAT family N-acetyltransferase [Gemmatimonadaceae bacterium]